VTAATPGRTPHDRITGEQAALIASTQARTELREFADEQAALRRVATLVGRAAPPEEVLAAVTAEAGRLLHAHHASLLRYGPDRAMTVAAAWGNTFPVGTRLSLGGRNVTTLVYETGRSARIEDYDGASGPAGEGARELGLRASVGVPIIVEDRTWGVMFVACTGEEPLPPGTEARLTGFTELAATAIANAQARMELRGFAQEQAALRRVATLVARAAAPGEVFAAVTVEAGRLLQADVTALGRYDPDQAMTLVAMSSSTDADMAAQVGTRVSLGGRNLSTAVFETGRPARLDGWDDVAGAGGDLARGLGIRSAVGVPVSVEGRLWGIMAVSSTREEPLPAGTEARLAGFTELVATAIANAEAQAALTDSRARIVTTADATRRRIERDLHDGAQQRLVFLALELRAAQAAVPPGTAELGQRLDAVAAGLTGVLEELREIARGLHPAVLDGGLRPALKALARRSAVPVQLHVQVEGRLPEPVEIAAYYVVSEALTNTAKHAHATVVDVEVAAGEGDLHVRVRDDGCGGAHFGHGSGLVGLKDRAEALGGRIWLHSPPGGGTALQIVLPLSDPGVRCSAETLTP
jgi:signal transduction histidine kinase